ncbi:MAG TPA: hypothetical protein VJN88_15925 [Ktedonobacterales bacterium]|nr:hypothetical protein [Ktedonobacterales bacterium]
MRRVAGLASVGRPPVAMLTRWRVWACSPRAWLLILVAGLLLALNLMDVVVPMDRDEGAFLAIAQEILRGHVPYRDVFDQKSPGIYYLLAGMLALTHAAGPITQLYIARLLTVVANVLTAAGVLALGRAWGRPRVGLLAAALWLFVAPVYGGAQLFTEPFAVPFTVWALAVVALEQSRRSAFSAGVLLAVGTLFKQTAVLALPGILLMLTAHELRLAATADVSRALWRRSLGAARVCLPAAAMLLVGLLAPWALVGVAFALAGALRPLIDQVLLSNLLRYPPDPGADRYPLMITSLIESPLLWLAPICVVGAVLYRRIFARKKSAPTFGNLGAAVALTGALSLLPLVSHAYLHYWVSALPWAALLTAYGLSAALARWRHAARGDVRRRSARTVGSAFMLAAVAGTCAISLVLPLLTAVALPHKRASLMRQVHASRQIAHYTSAHDRLLVLPAQPEYYFLTGRAPATPYVYLLPIDATSQRLATLRDQFRARWFTVVAWQMDRDHLDQQPGFPALYATLRAHYRLVAVDRSTQLEIFVPDSTGPAR